MNHRWLCSVFALKSVQFDLSGLWFEDGVEESNDTTVSGPEIRDKHLIPGHSALEENLPLWGVDSDPGYLVERGRGYCFLAC